MWKKVSFSKVFLKFIFFQIDFSLENNLPLGFSNVTKNYHTLKYYHNYIIYLFYYTNEGVVVFGNHIRLTKTTTHAKRYWKCLY